jgi:hypothetical protein
MKNVLLALSLLFIPGITAAAPINMAVEVTLDKSYSHTPFCTQAKITIWSGKPVFKLCGDKAFFFCLFDKDSFYHAMSLKLFDSNGTHALITLMEPNPENRPCQPEHLYLNVLSDRSISPLIGFINDTLVKIMGSGKDVWANTNHELTFVIHDVQPDSPWSLVLERTMNAVRDRYDTKARKNWHTNTYDMVTNLLDHH